MINVEKLPEMIEKNQIVHVKLFDYNGLFLHEIEAENAAECANKFEVDVADFGGYTKLKVKGATKAQANQNFRGCFEYIVGFNSPLGKKEERESGMGVVPSGYVSQEYMKLALELERMKLQINAKNDKQNLPELPLSWMPVLQGLGMIPANVQTPGLAGPQTAQRKATVHMTPEEEKDLEKKVEHLNGLMAETVSLIPIESCILMLQKLNAKLKTDPNFINTINAFL